MKTKSLVSVAMGIVLAISCAKEPVVADVQADVAENRQNPEFVDGLLQGEVIVEFNDETAEALSKTSAINFLQTKAADSDFLNEINVVSIERLFPDAGEREGLHRKMGLHRYYTVKYDSSVPTTKAESGFAQFDGVVGVEVPHQVQLCGIPFNDPSANRQWSFYNDGSKTGFVTGADINVVDVWNNVTTGDPNVIVAVVDEGINLNSVEFKTNTLPAKEGGSRNYIQGNYNIVPGSHGCNVGGIIGACNNNGRYCCGIAGGSDGQGGVTLMSLEVFEGSSGSDDGTMAKAIVYAADNGALVCNNSWGTVVDINGDGRISDEEYERAQSLTVSSSLISAFKYFNNYAGCDSDGNQIGLMKGGIVTFAAGNDNIDIGLPAMDENVIAVGSIGPDGKCAPYSNYGDWVDICAPGGNADFGSNGYIWQVSAEDGYLTGMVGTSQACPHVSGVAALVISARGGKGFTGEMLREMLLENASHKFDEVHAYPIGPLVDAYATVFASAKAPDQIKVWEASAESNRITADLTVPANTSKCVVAVSKNKEDLEAITSMSFPSTVKATVIEGVAEGDKVSGTVNHLQYTTNYYVAVYSVNVGVFTISEIREIKTPEDQAPEVAYNLPGILAKSKTETFKVCVSKAFTDPDGDDLTYTFKREGAKSSEGKLVGDTLTITCCAYGTSVYTVTAKDEGNKTVDNCFNVVVRDPKKNYAADVYPNPCSDVLYVAPGIDKSQETHVILYNVSGAVVYDNTASADAFNPVTIDVSGLAVGVYTIKVTFGDQVYEQSVMKI